MRGELKLPSALERKQLGDAARKGKLLKKVKRVRERAGIANWGEGVSDWGKRDGFKVHRWEKRAGGQIIIDEWADVEWHGSPGGVFKLPITGSWDFTPPEEPEPVVDPTDEWLENYKKENL